MNMLENRDVMDLSKLKKESFMEYFGKMWRFIPYDSSYSTNCN